MTDDVAVLRQLRVAEMIDWFERSHLALTAHRPGLDRLDAQGRREHSAADSGTDPGADLDQGAETDGGLWEDTVGPATSGGVGSQLVEAMGEVAEHSRGATSLTDLAARVAPQPESSDVGIAGSLLVAFLSGLCDVARNADHLDADRLAIGLEVGAAELEAAVAGSAATRSARAEPEPGSPVDVAHAVATAALSSADRGDSLAEMVIDVADAGLDALETGAVTDSGSGPSGLVDAAAAGLLVVIDTLVAVVHGDDPDPPEWEFPEYADPDGELVADERFRYRVELSLEPWVSGSGPGDDDLAALVRIAWTALGDSIDVQHETDPVRVSVCTEDIGAVIEAAIGIGRPSQIVVQDRRA